MRVEDILALKPLEGCRLLSGSGGLEKPVTGINILEAIDIEKWGSEGLIILSSYFALRDLSREEISRFFTSLDAIGISAVIIKIDRFVAEIPLQIVQLCEKYEIPLIQIGNETKYESIILEILTPLINKNAESLNKYYTIHKELTDLTLQMHPLDTILLHLRELLGHDITLYNTIRNSGTSTNPALEGYRVADTRELESHRYRSYRYQLRMVWYADDAQASFQLAAPIPYIRDSEYQLVLHRVQPPISVDDFMAIENAMRFLQLELLKQHSVKNHMRLHMNTLMGEILNGGPQGRSPDLFEALRISAHPWYQVLIVKCYAFSVSRMNLDGQAAFLRRVRYLLRDLYPHSAFYESPGSMIFLLNLEQEGDGVQAGPLQDRLAQLHTDDSFYYLGGLGEPCGRSGIQEGSRQAADTVKVLEILRRRSRLGDYEGLGVNKLFLQMGSLEEMRRLIPAKIIGLYSDEPDLFHTLATYLDTGRSLKDTAAQLFLHPKTVKYRIEKITAMGLFDPADPEDILQLQLAARMLRFLE